MTAILTIRPPLAASRRRRNLSPNRGAQGPQDPVHGQDLGGAYPLAEPQPAVVRGMAEEDLPVLRELGLEGGTALGGGVPAEGGQRAGQVEGWRHRREAQPEIVVEGVAERRVEKADPILERAAPEDRHLAHVVLDE